jgi:hypothetical protein
MVEGLIWLFSLAFGRIARVEGTESSPALGSLAPNPRARVRAKLFLGRDVADSTQSDPLADVAPSF